MSKKTKGRSSPKPEIGKAELARIMDELFAEKPTPRAVVLTAASLIEAMLERALAVELLPNDGGADELFDGAQAPLGSFSARIEVAYRMGLIDKDVRSALHSLRRIRNDFAHQALPPSMADSSLSDRILAFVTPFLPEGHDLLNPELIEKHSATLDPLDAFRAASLNIAVALRSFEIKGRRRAEVHPDCITVDKAKRNAPGLQE